MRPFTIVSIAAAVIIATGFLLPQESRLALWITTVVVYLTLMGLGVTFIRFGYFCRTVSRLNTDKPEVLLTFDDGPDPEATPALLQTLRELKIPALFFLIGDRARQYPEIVQAIIDDGHEIGNHTQRHSWKTNFLYGKKLRAEINACQQTLEEITGVRPALYRPPVGLTNPHLQTALNEAGLTLIGWDVRGLDSGAKDSAPVIRRVENGCRNGSIILLHDGGADPEILRETVTTIVRNLRARGFVFVPASYLNTTPAQD